MVTKSKGAGKKAGKKGRVAVGKLQLNKESVKNLSGGESKKIKGGLLPQVKVSTPNACIATRYNCT